MNSYSQLRGQFQKLPEVSIFASHPKFFAQVASLGLQREIGTVNDEMARFIFDAGSAAPVRLESLKAEFVEWKGLSGLKIFSTDSTRLELRTPGFYDMVHPSLSRNADGTLHSLYIFPELIERIARAEGVELVMVKSWGMNSIFGGFDPKKGYYQTNFWELENNDVLKFADLARQGRLAFMGTHDLIAHVAGVDRRHWPLLKHNASRVYEAVSAHIGSAKPSIGALVLPYTIGVVLDDLAQPPSYSSPGHIAVLNELLRRLAAPMARPALLTRFPPSFARVIETSREVGIEKRPERINSVVDDLLSEIASASLAS